MMVPYLKSHIMMMRMKMFLILIIIEFGQPSSPTSVNVQPGPAFKEANAKLSGAPISWIAQGGFHSSITPSCCLVGIGTLAQEQMCQVPG